MTIDNDIDFNSFIPLYYQLSQILYRKIMSGDLSPGEQIPSENELSEEYGLSRMTARKAVSCITEKGLVRRIKGKGAFVERPQVEGGLFKVPDFHKEMQKLGISSEVKLLKVKVVPAGNTPSIKLSIKKGIRVIYLERILVGGGEPMVFDRKYILLDSSQPLLEAELGHGSTNELFSNNPNMRPVRADLKLSATVLSPQEADHLMSSEGAPAFCLEQSVYAVNDKKVIWGWLIYRGDKFHFFTSSEFD